MTESWQKSSYSNGQGGNCVEARNAPVMTEAWKKSSYSNGDGGDCVEARSGGGVAADSRVLVRDTQNRGLGSLEVSSGAWTGLIATIAPE